MPLDDLFYYRAYGDRFRYPFLLLPAVRRPGCSLRPVPGPPPVCSARPDGTPCAVAVFPSFGPRATFRLFGPTRRHALCLHGVPCVRSPVHLLSAPSDPPACPVPSRCSLRPVPVPLYLSAPLHTHPGTFCTVVDVLRHPIPVAPSVVRMFPASARSPFPVPASVLYGPNLSRRTACSSGLVPVFIPVCTSRMLSVFGSRPTSTRLFHVRPARHVRAPVGRMPRCFSGKKFAGTEKSRYLCLPESQGSPDRETGTAFGPHRAVGFGRGLADRERRGVAQSG